MTYRQYLMAAIGLTCLSASPAFAYTPAVYNSTLDVGQDFTVATKLSTTVWSDSFSAGTGAAWLSDEATDALVLTISAPYNSFATDKGYMQFPTGCSQGYGYGRFHWRAKAGQLLQGVGINLILWNADNSWGSKKNVTAAGVYTVDEWDALEATGGVGYINIHTNNGVSGQSPAKTTTVAFPTGTLATYHDYDVDWAAGSMIEYVDGVQQASATGAKVPADYAHGGCNKTLGFQTTYQGGTEPLSTVQFNIANAWHANVIPTSTTTTTTPPPVAPASTAGTISAPTVPAASYGVAENITAAYAYTTGAPNTVKLVIDGATASAQTATLAGNVITTALPTDLAVGSHAIKVEDAMTSTILSSSTSFSVAAVKAVDASTLSVTGTSYSSLKLLTIDITKTTGKAQTLRYLDNGKYMGVMRDNAADGALVLHWLYSAAPTSGTHTITVYVDGGASATGTYTVD